MLYAIIIAGGRGERFWPLSRSGHPKQLLRLLSEKTLLQETIDRVQCFIPIDRTVVVTGENMQKAVLGAVPYLREKHILAEPEGRNTCLAIGLAAVHLVKRDPDAVMVVLSSDHAVQPAERLVEILKTAAQVASSGPYLLTLGVVPTRPETGYGYIELGERHAQQDGIEVFRVGQFKEKPSRTVAQEYYFDRKHLWNSGMFVWTARTFLDAVRQHLPELAGLLEAYAPAIGTPKEKQARLVLYQSAESISVDCAILEKAKNVLTIKSDFKWDDVGSWLALERVKPKDRENNVILGDSLLVDSYETTLVNDGEGLVVTYGVSDLVIVKTNQIVFVAHKTKVGDLKQLVAKLNQDRKAQAYL